MASTAQTSSVTTTQASDEVGGGPVPAADGLLPLEPQAVDRRETARAKNPAAVCRFRAFPARRAWSMSPPREVRSYAPVSNASSDGTRRRARLPPCGRRGGRRSRRTGRRRRAARQCASPYARVARRPAASRGRQAPLRRRQRRRPPRRHSRRRRRSCPLACRPRGHCVAQGLAEESALVSENVRVALPEFVQQPSRAFDVGEEESDSSSRELRHGAPPLRPRYAL
jgi:hypothetical protein